VARTEERIKEAGALGFRRCAMAATAAGLPHAEGALVTLERIADLAAFLEQEPRRDEP
jgi:hypothetical protein